MTSPTTTEDRRTLILPSLLAADPLRLGSEVAEVVAAGADMLHLDVMDGAYVPNLSFGPHVLAAVRAVCPLPLDVHLMIETPERTVDAYLQAGADIVSVHPEAVRHLHRLLERIRGAGKQAAVVLNPASPWQLVEWVLPLCHHVLVMSVNPGFGGQSFLPEVLPKVAALRGEIRRQGLATRLEIDGGITPDTAPQAVAAGADMLVAGSAIFGQRDRAQAIAALRAGR